MMIHLSSSHPSSRSYAHLDHQHSDRQQMSPQSPLRSFDGLFEPMRIEQLQMDHFQDFLRYRNLTVKQINAWKGGRRPLEYEKMKIFVSYKYISSPSYCFLVVENAWFDYSAVDDFWFGTIFKAFLLSSNSSSVIFSPTFQTMAFQWSWSAVECNDFRMLSTVVKGHKVMVRFQLSRDGVRMHLSQIWLAVDLYLTGPVKL